MSSTRSFSSASAIGGSAKKRTDWSARMRAMNETLELSQHSQQQQHPPPPVQGRTEWESSENDNGSVYSMGSMDRRDTTGLSHTRQYGGNTSNNNNNSHTMASPSPKRDSVVNMWRKRESSDSMHSLQPNTSHSSNNPTTTNTSSAAQSSAGRTSVVDQWRKRSSSSTTSAEPPQQPVESAAPSRAPPPAWKKNQVQSSNSNNNSYSTNSNNHNDPQQQVAASPWKQQHTSNPSPWKSRTETAATEPPRFASPGKPTTPSWKQTAAEPSELTIVPSTTTSTPNNNNHQRATTTTPSWKQSRAKTHNSNDHHPQESELTIVPSSPVQSATKTSVPSWKNKFGDEAPTAAASSTTTTAQPSYVAPWKQKAAEQQQQQQQPAEPATTEPVEYLPPWKKKLLANKDGSAAAPVALETAPAPSATNTAPAPVSTPTAKKKSFLPEPTKLNKQRSSTPSWKSRQQQQSLSADDQPPRSASVPAWQKRQSMEEPTVDENSPAVEEEPFVPAWKKKLAASQPTKSTPPVPSSTPSWKKKSNPVPTEAAEPESDLTIVPSPKVTPAWKKKTVQSAPSETEQEGSDLKIVPSPKVVRKESSNSSTPLWKNKGIGSSIDSASDLPKESAPLPPTPNSERPKSVKDFWAQQGLDKDPLQSVTPRKVVPAENLQEKQKEATSSNKLSVLDKWMRKQSRGEGDDDDARSTISAVSRTSRYDQIMALTSTPSTIGRETPKANKSVVALPIGDSAPALSFSSSDDEDDNKKPTSEFDSGVIPGSLSVPRPRAPPTPPRKTWGKKTPTSNFGQQATATSVTEDPKSPVPNRLMPIAHQSPKRAPPSPSVASRMEQFDKSETKASQLSPKKESKPLEPQSTVSPSVASRMTQYNRTESASHLSPKKEPKPFEAHSAASPSIASRMAHFNSTENSSQLSPKKEPKTFESQSAASPSIASRMANYVQTEKSAENTPSQQRITRPASPSIAMRMAQFAESGRKSEAPHSPSMQSEELEPAQIISPGVPSKPPSRWSKPTANKSSLNDLPELNHQPTQESTPVRKSSVLDRWPAANSQTPVRNKNEVEDGRKSPLPPIRRTPSRFGQTSYSSQSALSQDRNQSSNDGSVVPASTEEKRSMSRGRVSDRWPLAGNQVDSATAETTPAKRAPSRGRVLDRWPAAKNDVVSENAGDEIMPSMGPVRVGEDDPQPSEKSEVIDSAPVNKKRNVKKWPIVKTHERSLSRGNVADKWLQQQQNISDSQQSRNADFDNGTNGHSDNIQVEEVEQNEDALPSPMHHDEKADDINGHSDNIQVEEVEQIEDALPSPMHHDEKADDISPDQNEKMPNAHAFTGADDKDCPTEPESQEAELDQQAYEEDIDETHPENAPEESATEKYDSEPALNPDVYQMEGSRADQHVDINVQDLRERSLMDDSDQEDSVKSDLMEGEESLVTYSTTEEAEDELESQQAQNSGQKVTGRWSNRFSPPSSQPREDIVNDMPIETSQGVSQEDRGPTQFLAPSSPLRNQVQSPQIIPTNSPYVSHSENTTEFEAEGRVRIVPDDKDDEGAPFVGEYVLMLFSSQSLSRDQLAYQQQAKTIFMANKVPVAEIDGALIHNRDKRNELFNISGLWAKYPQFFVVGERDTQFWGDWETLQDRNEDGAVVASLGLRSNPQSEIDQVDETYQTSQLAEAAEAVGGSLGVPELTPEENQQLLAGEPQSVSTSHEPTGHDTAQTQSESSSVGETKDIETTVDTPSRKTSRLKYLAKRHHVAVSTSTPKNIEEKPEQVKTPASSARRYDEINNDVKGMVDRSVGSMASSDPSNTQPRRQIQQPKKSAVGSNRSAFSFNMSAHRKFASMKSKNTGNDESEEKEAPVEPVATEEKVPAHLRPSGIKGPLTSNSRIATRRLLTKKKIRAHMQNQKESAPRPEIQTQNSESSDFTESKSLLLMPSEEAPSTTTMSTFNPPDEHTLETDTVESGSRREVHPNPTFGSDFGKSSYTSTPNTRRTFSNADDRAIPDEGSGLTAFADQTTVGSKSDEEQSVGPYSQASSYGGRSYEVRSTASGFSRSSAMSRGSSIANRAERLLKQRRERSEPKIQKSPEDKARAENFTRRVLYGEPQTVPTPVHSNNSHSTNHRRVQSMNSMQPSNQQMPQSNMATSIQTPAPPSSHASGSGIMGKASAAILERARLSSRYQKSSRFMGNSSDDQDPSIAMSSLMSGDSGINQGPQPEYQQMHAHKMEVTSSASDDDLHSRNMGKNLHGGSYASGSFPHSGVDSEMGSNSHASPSHHQTIAEEDAESDSHSADQQSSSWFGGIFQGERKEKSQKQNDSKKNMEVKTSESDEHVGYNCNNFFNHEDVAIEVEYMEDESEEEDEEPNGTAAICGKACDTNSPAEKSAQSSRRTAQ